MMNKVEVKKRISGSVNPKDKYVMIEKLKDKNKTHNSLCCLAWCIIKVSRLLCVNCRTSSSIKGKTVTHVVKQI